MTFPVNRQVHHDLPSHYVEHVLELLIFCQGQINDLKQGTINQEVSNQLCTRFTLWATDSAPPIWADVTRVSSYMCCNWKNKY